MKPIIDFFKKHEYQVIQAIAIAFLFIGVVVLIVFLGIVAVNHGITSNFNNEVTQTVGVFIGGIVPVFISIATVLLVYITFKSNREEFLKINEANNYQQFSNTFEVMFSEIDKFLNDQIENKSLYDYNDGFIKSIKSVIRFGVNDNEKKRIWIDKISPEDCFSRKFTSGELDKLMLKKIREFNRKHSYKEVETFESGIIMIFEYLESSNRLSKSLNDIIKFYFFRLKNMLKHSQIENALFISSIFNHKIDYLVNKYDLVSNAYINDFLFHYKVKVSDKSYSNNDYKFDIRKYYSDGKLDAPLF